MKRKISIYSDTNYFKYGEGGFKSRGLNPPLIFDYRYLTIKRFSSKPLRNAF